MSRTQQIWIGALLCAASLLGLTCETQAKRVIRQLSAAPQAQEHVVVPIQGSRPLALAADQLQYKYGIPVSYEDVEWESREDLMRAGNSSNPKNRQLKNLDLMIPASGSLQFQFNMDSKTRTPLVKIDEVLSEVVEQHTARRNAGEFQIRTLGNGDTYIIAPGRKKNTLGTMDAAKSPFDGLISFAEAERNGQKTVGVILDAVTAATGAKFVIFDMPDLAGTTTLGAKNQVARDVLAKALRETYVWKAYWRLFYDPEQKVWGLTINSVYKEYLTPKGEVNVAPVLWPR